MDPAVCCKIVELGIVFVLTFVFVFVFANMLIPILPNRQCLCGPSWRGARNYKPCICIFIYICICIGIGISTYICICIGIGICTCEQGGLLTITGQVFAFSLTFVFVFVWIFICKYADCQASGEGCSQLQAVYAASAPNTELLPNRHKRNMPLPVET